MIKRMFIDHPQHVGESYGEHLRAAGGFGATMVVAGVACLVHAIVPGLFVRTGSEAISRLHDRMVVNRQRHKPEAEQQSAAAARR